MCVVHYDDEAQMAMGEGVPVDTSSLDSAQRGAILAQVDRLLASAAFASSARRRQFLRYVVDRALADGPGEFNEYAIGLDVFEKPPTFDPRIESIVRTEAGRLRQRLREYYAGEGGADPVVIEIPLRSYKPAFVFREPEAAPPAIPTSSRRWSGALLATLALAIAAGALVIWKAKTPPNPPIRSLVVLPFQDLSPDKANEYLSDGLTDELTNEFANWKELRVVARTSAYQYKGKGVDVRKIGRELNADAILEGSLARQGDRIRITAQLNRASDGYHLWSRSYDTRSPDMLTVQREIAQAIATAIRNLGGNIRNPPERPATNSPEALDLYLQANYQYARLDPASVERSIHLFQAAIEKDPAYARAYVGLAAAEMELTNFDPGAKRVGRARSALQEALKLDPDSGDAHGLLAGIAAYFDGDWPRGEREFRLALEKGAQASTRAAYGWCLARCGRFSEAQSQCSTAQNIEPLGVAPRFCQFYVYYYQRRYPQARKMLLETLELNPNLIYAHSLLGSVAVLEHDCAEAVRQFDWSARRLPAPAAAIQLAYGSACRGETQRARQYLDEAAASPGAPGRFHELAQGYCLLHDKDTAIRYLEKSVAAGGSLPLLLHEPFFDELRSDSRYMALEKRAGLSP